MFSPREKDLKEESESCAMLLIPQHVCPDVAALRPELLKKWGVTLVLADLDNTLAAYHEKGPSPAVADWCAQLRRVGIDLFILSNSRKPARVKEFARQLDVPYLGKSGKPSRKGFQRALKDLNRRADETVMVGDQIFTDILGGNRAGIRTILIQPTRLAGNPGRYLRYAIETPFRLLGARRGGL